MQWLADADGVHYCRRVHRVHGEALPAAKGLPAAIEYPCRACLQYSENRCDGGADAACQHGSGREILPRFCRYSHDAGSRTANVRRTLVYENISHN